MKNRILLLAVLCLSLSAAAQEQEWKIALHVDPNFSWMKPGSKDIEQGSNKLRFGFGIMIDKMFTDNYAFGTGLNVVNTGGELSYLYKSLYRSSNSSSNQEVIVNLNRTYNVKYLEIPLTLKLRTNEIGYITYWAQFGVGLGMNIGAKADDELTYVRIRNIVADDPNTADIDEASDTWDIASIKAETSEENDIKDDIKLFRSSLIIAAGIEYNLSGNSSILAGVTFNNGFSNMLNNQGVKLDSTGNPQIYNKKPETYDLKAIGNFISLNVGFMF
ncbi:MAG: PorT family protein [Flavobacteriales bacterium]|nr:PorT family protein [Flavobacteriales bacterium]